MFASSSLYFAKTSCPLGDILLVAQADALTGLYFIDQFVSPLLVSDVLTRKNLDNACKSGISSDSRNDDVESGLNTRIETCPEPVKILFNQAIHQIDAWFSGRRTTFDLPLRLEGTSFQREVLQALLSIPFGQILSYGDISKQLTGSTRSSRAVGVAIGKNPISIIVPCHRVVGCHGQLTGYSGGLERKAALLAHEGSLLV